jgi:hypothetical protein
MDNEKRLIEVMAELLAEVHEMRLEIKGMRADLNERVDGVNLRVDGLATKIEKLENEQSKTTLAIGELRLSVMKLSDFGERIFRLEKEVFNKAS